MVYLFAPYSKTTVSVLDTSGLQRIIILVANSFIAPWTLLNILIVVVLYRFNYLKIEKDLHDKSNSSS